VLDRKLFTLEVPVYRARLTLPTALVVLALWACDTRVPSVPELDPQVVNLRNDFAFQATGLTGVNEDVVYSWQIDGTTATVEQVPTLLLGGATIFVSDSRGVQVYQRSLAENGSFVTTTGVPGTWTIRMHFADASGDVGLHLAKQ
jgi:hypothetical protein